MTDMAAAELEQEAHAPHPVPGLATVPIFQSNTPPAAELGRHSTRLVGTTAGQNPVVELLGRDPSRAHAVVVAVDGPVVLASTKEDAQAAANASQGAAAVTPQVATVANPAAGAQFTYTVPAGSPPLTLQAVTFTLTTDAVVANRKVLVQVLDPAGRLAAEFPATGSVVASSTVLISLSVGSSQSGNGTSGTSFGSLSPLVLAAGWQVVSIVNNMDVGDTLTGITLALVAAAQLAANAVPPTGFFLPAGVAVSIQHADMVWCAATTPGPNRVSVIASITLGEKRVG